MQTAEHFDAAYALAIQAGLWLALPLIWLSFIALICLKTAPMAAAIFIPGSYYVRAFGWERGMILFWLTLLIAYRFTVSH